MRIQKFPPNLLPPLFRILCFTLLYSLVLEKHAWNNRSPAYKPETFPHCPRQKSVLIGNVWIFSLLAMCDQFVMYQSCQCIHLLCKFRRHLYFFGWRYDDVTRHSAAWYIYIYDTLYVHIYMLYVGFVQRFANREISWNSSKKMKALFPKQANFCLAKHLAKKQKRCTNFWHIF